MLGFLQRFYQQPSPPGSFHELSTLDSDWGQQALAIYNEAFPVEEREPLDELTATVNSRETGEQTHHFRVMVDADGQVAGISIFTVTHPQYMAFLRFIAVRSDLRSRGLGRAMLRDVVREVRRDGRRRVGYPYLGVVFEVERPAEAHDESEYHLRERRIRWYRRNGAKVIPHVDLVTPPVTPDQPPMRYHMMFVTAVPKVMPGSRLRRMMVESVLVAGYGEPAESWHIRRTLVNDPV